MVSFRHKWPDNLYSILRLPLVLQARLVLISESGFAKLDPRACAKNVNLCRVMQQASVKCWVFPKFQELPNDVL